MREDRVQSWALVAGTGLRQGIAEPAVLAAEEVGAALARADLGVITGGWPGVDHIVARTFSEGLAARGISTEHRLVQVIREDRPIEINVGKVVRTRVGPSEWMDPQSYADSVILIGGLGGAYGSFLGALHKGLPRFPIAGTGGDAAGAFKQMMDLWDVIPNPGMSRAEFDSLSARISTRDDARRVAQQLVGLIRRLVSPISTSEAREPTQVFLSHSREDIGWLNRFRTVLRPLERQGYIKTWADLDIEAGAESGAEISRKVQSCDAAVLLVSAHFLASDYLNETELPQLLARARSGKLRLFWVLVSSCMWDLTELAGYQPANDVNRPLVQMTDAEAQVSLVDLARRLWK
ncbi:TIR domain-containing protein [Sorangium sp. So ce394]|uniref:toll/interleukin-1 receptor domain-containing protein n=1 Tax=Sorangium sp. So ce394 TaxID=3133310 RepID=UPI003F5BBAAE